MTTARGIFECMTPHCAKRATPVECPWSGDWPLRRRQHKCSCCGRRMLFVHVKRAMPAEVKRRLRESRLSTEVA